MSLSYLMPLVNLG